MARSLCPCASAGTQSEREHQWSPPKVQEGIFETPFLLNIPNFLKWLGNTWSKSVMSRREWGQHSAMSVLRLGEMPHALSSKTRGTRSSLQRQDLRVHPAPERPRRGSSQHLPFSPERRNNCPWPTKWERRREGHFEGGQ